MSGIEAMEDIDGEEEIVKYICRRCPGMSFTAAEKDAHKLVHKTETNGKKAKKRKPGPKSKTGRFATSGESSLVDSETLFVEINDEPKSEPVSSEPNGSGSDAAGAEDVAADGGGEDGPRRSKRKSKKNYDEDGIEKLAHKGIGA